MGGNIITASPISDLNPVLLAANASFVVVSKYGKKEINARDFFLSYRKVAIESVSLLFKFNLSILRMKFYIL